MKERQRWGPEEDAILRAYVKQHGPREWDLVSQRMNRPLNRDGKSCLERWRNYLKPGLKKGSLTEEEQRLVIQLQSKHGNKWKKIAAEVPGRTAKRLGKWWEVYKEKQQREQKQRNKTEQPAIDKHKYDRILENFAEKLVQHQDSSFLSSSIMIPTWLSGSNGTSTVGSGSQSPSVTLSLSPLASSNSRPVPWLHPEVLLDGRPPGLASLPSQITDPSSSEKLLISSLVEYSRDLEEGHRAWAAQKKESAWRLRRLELQLESEKSCHIKEKMKEIEAKKDALRQEEKSCIDRIENEYKDQLAALRRDAEAKEQKFVEQWTQKHVSLTKFLEQMACKPRHS